MSRLNNKGQVLVLFILLLPLLLLVMVLVIDIGNIITAKQELNDINYLVIDSKLENTNMTDQEMIKLIGLNAKDLKNIDIQNFYKELEKGLSHGRGTGTGICGH